MTETAKPVQAFTIDYRCDKCNKGFMRSTGMVLTVDPPLFPARCNKCGHTDSLDAQYPYIEHREPA